MYKYPRIKNLGRNTGRNPHRFKVSAGVVGRGTLSTTKSGETYTLKYFAEKNWHIILAKSNRKKLFKSPELWI